ncbi:phosphate ABC transporter permease subunit PstC [Halomicrococcus gelatinilyticus]|uniref:phosphate ABC transporter permease subunit PstC n=1 Tax=Halomicrococcus gelatinilyticus TaxID=1702103 RepID=UPI002E12D889
MSNTSNVTRWRNGARERFVAAREFVATTETDALVTATVGILGLVGAFVGFVLTSPYTSVAVGVFLVSVVYGWLRHQELTARWVTLAMTVSTSLILALILVFIVLEAWPALQYESAEVFGISVPGLRAFTDPNWRPASNPKRFSMLPMIHGTVLVTVIATLVAGPLGVAAALFLSEIAPPVVREFVKPGVEILAGIPSIVYGFLGFVVLGPWVSDRFDIVGQGTYLFVGIVVGLMALPTVVSVAEDAINSVPESMKSGSLAMGTTDWQTMTAITIPAAFSGISAAVLLGVGRAIGETMAATVMLRNQPEIAEPLYNVFYGFETLTSVIANKYGSATGTQESSLFVAGIILFVSVLLLSIGSQMIEAHMHRKLGGNE